MPVVAASPAESYRAARAQARAMRRDRALARVPTERRARRDELADPLAHERTDRLGPSRWLAASVAAHVAVVAASALAPLDPSRGADNSPIAMEIIQPPPPEVPPAVAPPAPTPDRPIPTVDPVAPPPKPIERITPAPKDEPPPDPTEPVAAAAEPVTTKPARRVVGINLGSTVVGGGPAFAVGNTRMGETSRIAADPGGVAAATGTQLVPPRRTSEVQPEYPPALRAQNVEGDVVLKVEVDATGRVGTVVVVQPSPHEAFNQAAMVAAKRSTYSPALLNGAPVANSIQFTVRFRLKR
jgi:protein TonB